MAHNKINWQPQPLNKNFVSKHLFRRLATSHFEPTYARRAFPCFDEPHLKAKFLMTITHDRNLKAFFNTPKKGPSSEVRGRPDQVNIITSFYWVYFLESFENRSP